MFNLFKKKLPIILYGINKRPKEGEELDPTQVLTFVSNQEDAFEFIGRKALIERKEHYKSWCELQSLDYKNTLSQQKYITEVLIPSNYLDNFEVRMYEYDPKNIALIFRLYSKCAPIGCSYESVVEKSVVQLKNTI